MRAETEDGKTWSAAYGRGAESEDIQEDTPYFIASVTKIYTSVAITLLHEQGKLNLTDSVQERLPDLDLAWLHNHKGKDRTSELKIFHLLGHTSGLPDYFEQAGTGGKSLPFQWMARVATLPEDRLSISSTTEA